MDTLDQVEFVLTECHVSCLSECPHFRECGSSVRLPAIHLHMFFLPLTRPQGLGVVPAEEWDEFMAIIRQPLPSTFRITGTQHLATAVRQCLQHTFFSQLTDAMQRGLGEGEELTPPTPLPW